MSNSEVLILKSGFRDQEVRISGSKAALLRFIIDAGDKGVTSLDLARAEFLGVTKLISQLRQHPILLPRVLVTVKDSKGAWREGVARYWFEGCLGGYELVDTAPPAPKSKIPQALRRRFEQLQIWVIRLDEFLSGNPKRRNPGGWPAHTGFQAEAPSTIKRYV